MKRMSGWAVVVAVMALAGPAFAGQPDVQKDKRELKKDRTDLSTDARDVAKDKADLKDDTSDGQKVDAKKDQAQLKTDKRQAKRDARVGSRDVQTDGRAVARVVDPTQPAHHHRHQQFRQHQHCQHGEAAQQHGKLEDSVAAFAAPPERGRDGPSRWREAANLRHFNRLRSTHIGPR